MKINLSTPQGIEKLQTELDCVQQNTRARNITASEIMEASQCIFEALKIPKKALNGCRFKVDLNAKNLMKYGSSIPESTIFILEFRNGHWLVTDLFRGETHREGSNVKANLSDEAKEALIRRFSSFEITKNTIE